MFKSQVLGHPSGLFVLFFTEMWERFSFYGMRVLLINFLTMAMIGTNPGWEWTTENAGTLFATYAGLLYLTPILGGVIADKLLGYRNAVVVGALIMTLGHAAMAIETEASLYLGLALLVIGTGFFKPTMTSIISEMYEDIPEKKDGAYTIYYMGVNAGAFFGMMLCGYMAEKLGWSWGFGLAGIFMLLGLLQFWRAKPLFGSIGDKPVKSKVIEVTEEKVNEVSNEKLNPFTLFDKIFTVISSVFGLVFLLHGPFEINGLPLIPKSLAYTSNGEVVLDAKYVFILIGLLVFFLPLVISRISRYEKVVKHRMITVVIFAFFTVFFWMSFEQGASSLVLFARDYTDRILEGGAATAYFVIDILLTYAPLAIVSWVLYLLWKATGKIIRLSNIILAISFLGVWGISFWKTYRDLNTPSYSVEYQALVSPIIDEKTGETTSYEELPITNALASTLTATDIVITKTDKLTEYTQLETGSEILMSYEVGAFRYVNEHSKEKINNQLKEHPEQDNPLMKAKVTGIRDESTVEITTSWFSILNSFFIIAFASLFSKWWDSKYNPSAAVKYGLGLIIMAIGFGILAYGSSGIGDGDNVVRVSIIWLVLAYLFHTLGELCLSPVGLSYVSKLVPARMIGFMYGMWYLAIAIGNYAAGSVGGMIESIKEEYSMATFFMIFTLIPAAAGLIVILLNPVLKRLMHGVK